MTVLRLTFAILCVSLIVTKANAQFVEDFWIDPTGGFFDIGSNWGDGTAPSLASEQANFIEASTYDVKWDSITGNVENGRLHVRAGNVTFRSEDSGMGEPVFTYSLSNNAYIGDSRLNIGNGVDRHNLDVGTELSIWNGELHINRDSNVNAANVKLNTNDDAETSLCVVNDASLNVSGSIRIGENSGTVASLDLDNGATVSCGFLGLSTGCSFSVRRGSILSGDYVSLNCQTFPGVCVDTPVIGVVRDPGSNVTVADTLTIGEVGIFEDSVGFFFLENAASVNCGKVVIEGPTGGSVSTMLVSGDSTILSTNNIEIAFGVGLAGLLRVDNEASVQFANQIDIGSEGQLALSGPGFATLAGGTVENRGDMLFTAPFPDVIADIHNSGTLLTLGAAETYIFGNLMQEGGEVFTNDGAFTRIFGSVSGEGTFTGPGTVQMDDFVYPGVGSGLNSAGEIRVEGNLSLASTARTSIELGGQHQTQYDRLTVQGDLSLNGELEVSLSDGFSLENGQQFVIAEVGGLLNGQFFGLPEGSLVTNLNGTDLFITYTSGDGNEVAVYTEGVQTLAVETFQVITGNHGGGAIPELTSSDNADVIIQRNPATTAAITEFEVCTTSPIVYPGRMELTLEGAVFARSQVNQLIRLFDYDSGTWTTVHTSAASRLTDATVEVTVPGDVSRFVDPDTLEIKVRVRFVSPVPRQQFSSNTDQLQISVGP